MAPKKQAGKKGLLQAPVEADPDMPEGATEIDDGDVDEVLMLDDGDSITGIYCGFKVTKSGQKDKDSHLHKFRVETGATVGIWGSYQLDQKLERAGVGAALWIKYLGKVALGNGNTLRSFRVAVLDEVPF